MIDSGQHTPIARGRAARIGGLCAYNERNNRNAEDLRQRRALLGLVGVVVSSVVARGV